jgi:hypothetical protein
MLAAGCVSRQALCDLFALAKRFNDKPEAAYQTIYITEGLMLGDIQVEDMA